MLPSPLDPLGEDPAGAPVLERPEVAADDEHPDLGLAVPQHPRHFLDGEPARLYDDATRRLGTYVLLAHVVSTVCRGPDHRSSET